MTNDFPFVATNTFSPSPANSYIQQQQAFMTGLAAKLERDEITGIDEQDVEIQRLCAAVDEAPEVVAEPEDEQKGIVITALAVFAGLAVFGVKHFVTLILTLLTYVDVEIADNLLGNQ